MKEKIEKYLYEIKNSRLESKEEIEQFKLKFLSRKNVMNELFKTFNELSQEDKQKLGKYLNELKNVAKQRFNTQKTSDGEGISKEKKYLSFDCTLPTQITLGSRHPISIIEKKILSIFKTLGFDISEGREIETEWYNFSALHFPQNHPARDMQDTFFLSKDKKNLLRTHTSTVQIRSMEQKPPPIRTLAPGRVYRCETISARSHCIFHQVEGLSVGKTESFRELRSLLYYFSKQMFGEETKIRLRPSYFPFTEPSGELDISCPFCNNLEGCSLCKYTGWVEIAGCGMIDPQVLKNCHIDPQQFIGYAFGMGIERIAMLKYKIEDIRLFTENDIRFLEQFKGL